MWSMKSIRPALLRPLAGVATVMLISAIVVAAAILFKGGFADTVPVTVLSQRAGLVMNPDARVKIRGVEVGKVASIEQRVDGQAALHLDINPSKLDRIPANVRVNIASTTVFGAKFVELIPPIQPSPQTMYAGQVLDAQHVTVEINTVFQRLTSVLDQIDPAKLNETLGAVSRAFSGRGNDFGQSLSDLDALLTKLEPGLPSLRHELSVAPNVLNVYADTAADLLSTTANASRVSQTVVDEQNNLDALLVSVIGLADTGTPYLSDNRTPLTNALHHWVPTLSLTDDYNPALTCGFKGLADLDTTRDVGSPGVGLSANFLWGHERYRYPGDLPKVAAKGGPHCEVLPVPYQGRPPYLVTDTGTNPFKYGNQGLMLNTEALKQYLFGPLDGPPRNTAQIGQPG
jgi:phospholipid/cholesterol/gamma-HCH transport system substrate-binding protein